MTDNIPAGQLDKAIENIRGLGYDCSGWRREFLADIALAAMASFPDYTEQCVRGMTKEGRDALLRSLMTWKPGT